MKEKKLKIISVRLSQEDYEKYKSDFQYCKNNTRLVELYGYNKIKTFSDYIRFILKIGYLEV